MKKIFLVGSISPLLFASSCAATQLGYDQWTGTTATPTRGAELRIECPRSTQSCLERAEAVCHGPYRVIGSPSKSPRVQAEVDWRIMTVNTDNPSVIHVVCG
jgi:hypothetical protein